eukprot:5509923-Pleurochrysis_carterae.AAC.3
MVAERSQAHVVAVVRDARARKAVGVDVTTAAIAAVVVALAAIAVAAAAPPVFTASLPSPLPLASRASPLLAPQRGLGERLLLLARLQSAEHHEGGDSRTHGGGGRRLRQTRHHRMHSLARVEALHTEHRAFQRHAQQLRQRVLRLCGGTVRGEEVEGEPWGHTPRAAAPLRQGCARR